MDSFPELDVKHLAQEFKESDQAFFDSLTRDFQSHTQKIINSLKEKFSTIATKTVDDFSQTFKADLAPKMQDLINLVQASLKPEKTNKVLTSLCAKVLLIEKLIFLVRYFNCDNTETYQKLIFSKGTKMNSINYSFNKHIEWYVKSLIDNAELDAKELLNLLINNPEKSISTLPANLATTRIPPADSENKDDITTLIQIDYYHLSKTFSQILRIIENFSKNTFQEKVNGVLNSLSGDSSDRHPDSSSSKPGDFGENNPIIAQLEEELKQISSITSHPEFIEYIFKPKDYLDSIVTESSQYERKAKGAAKHHITEMLNRKSSETTSDRVPLLKTDELISNEIQKYSFLSNRKPFTHFVQEYESQIKEESINIISSEKFLVQSAYIPIYFEEKFVVFQLGKGDFVHENFAKLIQEFCNLAVKEYKKVDVKKDTALHPLYFCYVSENEHDFYLVEYDPNNTLLRVYLTSAPMLSTLHKHLAKLDIHKLQKKSIAVTLLNYYDGDLNLEFRKVFLDTKIPTNEDLGIEEVSDKFRYFVFITIFLLKNAPVNTDWPEINFSAHDFITFFNYMADYQAVYLRHHNQKEPIPTMFESLYPFVDLRRPKQSFLLYNKLDPARGKSLVSVRTACVRDKNFFNYEKLSLEDEKINEEVFNADILKFLRKSEVKTSFNFDGPNYIHDFLKRTHMSDGFVKIVDKKQGQAFYDIFTSGDENKQTRIFDDSSKYSKIYILFPCNEESQFLLLVEICRKEKRITAYTFSNSSISFLQEQHPEGASELKKFISFLADGFKLDKEKLKTKYIKCTGKEEIVLQFFKRHYFPYTFLIEKKSHEDEIEVTIDDFIEPFKYFLNLNIGENNLDIFKAYNLIYEEMSKHVWRILNIQTLWKYTELRFALESLADKIVEDGIKHCLLAFNFLGFVGRKTYYLYFREKADDPSREETKESNSEVGSYLVSIYSLAHNLDYDDQEVMSTVFQFCATSDQPRFIFNSAYKVSTRNNILLYNQVEITLTTLSYLSYVYNMPMERAFQKVSQSIVSHYEILENLMDQTKLANQLEASHQKGPGEKQIESSGNQVKNVKIHHSFFEEAFEEMEYQKKLEAEICDVLNKQKNTTSKDIKDLYAFTNILNCEDRAPVAYTYAIDDSVIKKILVNEGNMISDKNVYKLILEDITNYKSKYEEALNIIYPENQIFFIMPATMVEVGRIVMAKYVLNKRTCVYYYLKGEQVPKLNDNILTFIQRLDAAYLETIKNHEDAKFEVIPYEIIVSKNMESAVETQYDLLTKFFIYLFSRQSSYKEERIEIDSNSFNNFLCDYADEMFGVYVEKSPVKEHYRYLSNLFLQTNSPITKKISLLTFLNGTASIEQLNIINQCIKSFKSDFRKISNIENAFFCFNVGVKSSIKHFLLHLYGSDKKNMSLKIFTNAVGDSDAILDRMIQTYAGENDAAGTEGEELVITQLSMYKIHIPNKIFTKYLEISSFLMAHAVCNDMRDSSEVCALLALSSAHYLNELKAFEEKCRALDIFKNIPGNSK